MSAIFLTERDVCELVDLRGAIQALRETVVAQARGAASNVPKAMTSFGNGSSMHALGSLNPGLGQLGFKNWVFTRQGGGSIYSLFDANQGTLLALIEARALGQLRTSGIAGVATDAMAAPDANVLALIGTGQQSMLQLAAVAAVRPLREVRVYSPTAERRRAFVEAARTRFPFAVTECASLAQATQGAPIVTLITRAKEPFVSADVLAEGAHLNAVGAILPTSAELEPQVLRQAALIAVDDMENARRGSRELAELHGGANTPWPGVRTLGELLAGPQPRRDASGFTIFKGMGMGLSDLAIATLVYQRAQAAGRGVKLPPTDRVNPMDFAVASPPQRQAA
jgi:ornithine cyclodeaminase